MHSFIFIIIKIHKQYKMLLVVIPGQHDCGDQKHPNRSLSMDEATAYLLVHSRIDILETLVWKNKTLQT